MTFAEKYQKADTWNEKVLVMELFHLAMSQRDKEWTVTKTATEFGCSIGLTSENLRIAHISHMRPSILKCSSRQEALQHLRKGEFR